LPSGDVLRRTASEISAYIARFHLDALTSGVPLNVGLDTTLTVVAAHRRHRGHLRTEPA